ncbi:MAG: hypothetical protein PUF08_07650, partial [Clostridiales bacterium]|nr:hypothetical protein [Clostridiales bacterium]
IDIIKTGIKEIFEKQSTFDEIHKRTCSQLVKAYSNVKIKDSGYAAFSFGNAQKWFNMTMKYIYIIGNCLLQFKDSYDKVNADFVDKYAIKNTDFWNKVHIPVDSYILQALWEDNNFNNKDLPDGKIRKKDGEYSSEKIKPWSQWNEEDYIGFWKHLSSVKQSPIEWEGPAWIEIAQKRNKQ